MTTDVDRESVTGDLRVVFITEDNIGLRITSDTTLTLTV
jgi:hypothetical protein